MTSYTVPNQYCRDIDLYEKAIVTAIDKLLELMNQGYYGSVIRKEVWTPLLDGLYGNDEQ